jgi:hypothetical protein
MSLFFLGFILAVIGYLNKKPARVIHYQPLEVPKELRQPSPWLRAPELPILPRAASAAPLPPPVLAQVAVQAPITAKPLTAKAAPGPVIAPVVPQWTDLTQALHEIHPPSAPVAPIRATRAAAPVVTQARAIAAKPQRAKAPVVVTVSTQIRLDALGALRRLGFSQQDAQAQLDTALGLAIQQSLLTGRLSALDTRKILLVCAISSTGTVD